MLIMCVKLIVLGEYGRMSCRLRGTVKAKVVLYYQHCALRVGLATEVAISRFGALFELSLVVLLGKWFRLFFG